MTFEFFRKYNKPLMIIGAGSMVLFLVGSVITNNLAPKPSEIPIGTVGNRTIIARDVAVAGREMQVLRTMIESTFQECQLALQSAAISPTQSSVLQRQMQELNEAASVLPRTQEADLMWVLMVEEAKQQGLWASAAESNLLIDRWGVSDATRQRLVREKVSDELLTQALRHYHMVDKLRRLALTRGYVSEPKLRHMARDTWSSLGVKLIKLPAEQFMGDIEEPTNEELDNRFKQNAKDVDGESEPYGFGYRLPSRANFEFITLNQQAIENSIKITEIEANKFYQDNPSLFLPEPPDQTDAEETSTTRPAETPADNGAETPDPDKPLPYRDVRDKVYSELREARARDLKSKATQYIYNTMVESVRKWPVADDGYRIPPASGWMSMEQVAESVQQEFGFLPTYERVGSLIRLEDEVAQVPGIGNAFVPAGSERVSLPVLLTTTHELGLAPIKRNPFRLQVGVIAPPLFDPSGNTYLMRITEVDPPRPPLNIGEVLNEVAEDVKQLKAYGKLKREAGEFLNMARADGLETVIKSLGPGFAIDTLMPFPRREVIENRFEQELQMAAPALPELGRNEAFVDAVFEAGKKIMAAGGVDKVEPHERFAVFHVDKDLTVYLIEFTAYEPLTSDLMRGFVRQMVAQRAVQTEQVRMYKPSVYPFQPELIKNRVGFVDASDGSEDDLPDGDDDLPGDSDPTVDG